MKKSTAMKKVTAAKKYGKYTLALSLLAVISTPAFANEGYYGSVNIQRTYQEAKNLDTSNRPGAGPFVVGQNKNYSYNHSIAFGYQFGNGWRTEGEYTFSKKTNFSNGINNFPNSYNMKVKAERIMLNLYRDYYLTNSFSIYGTAGLGVSAVEVRGWLVDPSREYGRKTQNNLTYALGMGISYAPMDKLTFDLGYRYVDMGKIKSGNRLRNEEMRARLVSSELLLGVRYLF